MYATIDGTRNSNPSISETIQRWTARAQARMPVEISNSMDWRDANGRLEGSACGPIAEGKRRSVVKGWMWSRLGDEAVMKAVPGPCRGSWGRMLAERTSRAVRDACNEIEDATGDATHAVIVAANAAAYAYATDVETSVDAAEAAAATTEDSLAFWERANPAALLVRLIETR